MEKPRCLLSFGVFWGLVLFAVLAWFLAGSWFWGFGDLGMGRCGFCGKVWFARFWCQCFDSAVGILQKRLPRGNHP